MAERTQSAKRSPEALHAAMSTTLGVVQRVVVIFSDTGVRCFFVHLRRRGSGRRVRSLQSDRLKPATPAEGASEVFTVPAVLTVLISLRCVRWLGETSSRDASALALPTSRYEPLLAAYEPLIFYTSH